MAVTAAVTFEYWTVSAGLDAIGVTEFAPWSVDGTGYRSGGVVEASLEAWSSTGQGSDDGYHLNGSVTLEAWTAQGGAPGSAALSLEVWTSSGSGRGPAVGSVSFEMWATVTVTAEASFSAWTSSGVGSAQAALTFHVSVMNMRTKGVTEYTNYEFNSFAKRGNSYFAAGEDGLVLLDGANDDGVAIPWSFRTGLMDDGDVNMKRLDEVVLATRSTGRLRVTVYPEDEAGHDYVLPLVRSDKLHQHRVKPGRGLRSRWYSIKVAPEDTTDVECVSMQVNFAKTNRRLG